MGIIGPDTTALVLIIMNSNLLICLLVLGVATTAWSWPNYAAKRFLQQYHKRAGCDMQAAEACGDPGDNPPQSLEEVCAMLKKAYKCAVDAGCGNHPEIQKIKSDAGPELGCTI